MKKQDFALLKTICIVIALIGLAIALPMIIVVSSYNPIVLICPIALCALILRTAANFRSVGRASVIETMLLGALGATTIFAVWKIAPDFDIG